MRGLGNSRGLHCPTAVNGFIQQAGIYGLSGIIPSSEDLKTVKKIVQAVAKVAEKIGVGGASQKRFFLRYDEIKKALNANGYTLPEKEHDALLDQFRIRKTQIKDNKPGSNYAPEFARLFEWTITRVNLGNPGLGTYWAQYFPFKMVNEGQIGDKAVNELKALLQRFPAGRWKGEEIYYNLVPEVVVNPAGDANTTTFQQVVNGYKVVKDVAGNVKEIRDATGKLLSPQSPGYSEIVNQSNQPPKVAQAGMGGWVGVGLALALLTGAVVMSKGDNKKEKQNA